MNKYIDIANSAGSARTVRATGVASVFVDKATTPDSPIIILYGNGSKWTVSPTDTGGGVDDSFIDADAFAIGKAIADTAATNWREVSSTFSKTLSQPIATIAFTF
tara:strand:- start:27 stop:341 length:315 start_codon:yes stop_codon:yes gene_type:complete